MVAIAYESHVGHKKVHIQGHIQGHCCFQNTRTPVEVTCGHNCFQNTRTQRGHICFQNIMSE